LVFEETMQEMCDEDVVPDQDFVAGSFRWVQAMLHNGMATMERRFIKNEGGFQMGDVILYLLELGQALGLLLESGRFDGQLSTQRRILLAMCEKEPVYLKWNMIRARSVIRKLRANQVEGIQAGTVVDLLFDDKAMAAFRKLGNWLGLKLVG
jgi:hypothetical protein